MSSFGEARLGRRVPADSLADSNLSGGDTQAADEHFTARRIGRITERRRVIFDSKPSQGKREAAPGKKKKKNFSRES